MTGEFDTPFATDESGAEASATEAPAELLGVSTEASLAAGLPDIPRIPDINLDNAEKAAKWVYHRFMGDDHEPPTPTAPVIDLPVEEEETSLRSTWVEHDDPPPPPPTPER